MLSRFVFPGPNPQRIKGTTSNKKAIARNPNRVPKKTSMQKLVKANVNKIKKRG